MDCRVCQRTFSKSRRPTCPSCAQARLYRPRADQATTLFERENAHIRSEAIVRPGNDGVLAALPADADWDVITDGAKKHGRERSAAEQTRIESKIEDILEQAKTLRQQTEQYKTYIGEKRQENQKRSDALAKERELLEQRRQQVLDTIKTDIKKASRRVDRVHNKKVEARTWLCDSASDLSGLHEVKDGRGRPTGRYALEGLTLPNLKELHAPADDFESLDPLETSPNVHLEHHQRINVSLDNICRLVGLWSLYLSIRLPSEILLPHDDFPHSAILSERSSYKIRELEYPVKLDTHTHSPGHPRSGKLDLRILPKPRLLHLDRPLARLMREDSKAFGLFVEGVTLLAWDVAWLCRSQSITSINTFSDVCNIGKNLWLFSRAPRASSGGRPSLTRVNTAATDATDITTRSKKSTDPIRFGCFSHSSLKHALAGHEGAPLFQNWKLSQPHRLVDNLRSYLLAEITGEEWDVLSEGDYFADKQQDEPGVLVGGDHRHALESKHPAMSVMSVAPHDEPRPNPGDTGWMKVRGRNTDS